jgi:hypothetical protein
MFQVTPGNVSFIVKGRTWRHLLGKPSESPDMAALRADLKAAA